MVFKVINTNNNFNKVLYKVRKKNTSFSLVCESLALFIIIFTYCISGSISNVRNEIRNHEIFSFVTINRIIF